MKRSAYIPVLAVATLSLLTMVTGCSKLQARDQLIKGVQAYKNAKFEEAIDHFQNAERLDPTLRKRSSVSRHRVRPTGSSGRKHA